MAQTISGREKKWKQFKVYVVYRPRPGHEGNYRYSSGLNKFLKQAGIEGTAILIIGLNQCLVINNQSIVNLIYREKT